MICIRWFLWTRYFVILSHYAQSRVAEEAENGSDGREDGLVDVAVTCFDERVHFDEIKSSQLACLVDSVADEHELAQVQAAQDGRSRAWREPRVQ